MKVDGEVTYTPRQSLDRASLPAFASRIAKSSSCKSITEKGALPPPRRTVTRPLADRTPDAGNISLLDTLYTRNPFLRGRQFRRDRKRNMTPGTLSQLGDPAGFIALTL